MIFIVCLIYGIVRLRGYEYHYNSFIKIALQAKSYTFSILIANISKLFQYV